jgi:hypothetical protein
VHRRSQIDKPQGLNARLIAALCEALRIEATLLWSSQLAPKGQPSARLLSILRHLAELDHLSPPAGRVSYRHFEPHPYPQRGAQQFEARLSIIDVIASWRLLGARSYLIQAPVPSTPAEPEAHPNRPETRGPALRA